MRMNSSSEEEEVRLIEILYCTLQKRPDVLYISSIASSKFLISSLSTCISAGDKVVNDHIALRTYNLPKVSIEKLAKPFLENGYVEGGDYHFEEKKQIEEKEFEKAVAALEK